MNDEGPTDRAKVFEESAQAPPVGLLREFFDFLRYEKKWWLTPIILILLLVSLFALLAGSPLAPFIYPF